MADRIDDSLPEGTVDVCVIGSGPGGAVTAVELARAGLRVAILEAGDAKPDSYTGAGLGNVNVGGAAEIAFGRAFQLGGSTNLWAGRIAPMTQEDFSARANVPLSGWPIEHSTMVPFYSRARKILGAPKEPELTAASGWEALLAAPGVAARPFVWANTPFRAGDWLREQMRTLPALSVTLGSRVTSLCQDGAGHVTAARILRPDGSTAELRARMFVLAAGGLEVVRILFNSTERCATGLGNEHDMLGRCFSTHPKADIGLLLLSHPVPARSPILSDTRWGSGRMRLGIGLDAQAQQESGALNHYVQLSPLAEYRASRAFELVKGRAALGSPMLRRQRAVHGVLAGLGLWGFDMVGRAARLQRRARLAVMRGFLDQTPDLENRLTRSDSSDGAGVPLLDIRWRFTEADRASVLAFLDRLGEAAAHAKIGRLDNSALRASKAWELTALHSHFLGGTRMGNEPRDSVTNADGRVYGVPNLHIVGPSLFPTFGYANPVMTIVALSLRIAERIIATSARTD